MSLWTYEQNWVIEGPIYKKGSPSAEGRGERGGGENICVGLVSLARMCAVFWIAISFTVPPKRYSQIQRGAVSWAICRAWVI